MKEIWDGYYFDGTSAFTDIVRGEKIPEGLYHLVSEILVRHTDGDFLLMLRDPSKENYGGFYEASCGGSALKGEDSLMCASRELYEETGIRSDKFEQIGRFVSHDTIYFNYLCVTDCDKRSITLQIGETAGYKWVNEDEFVGFVNSNKMIDVQKTRYMPYLKKQGYIK
ncbi:MAG: NUDIX domain-containing protein [Clostridia bacterium]|nr:NUDIX domain-containing protein [Clostridia bacterium]